MKKLFLICSMVVVLIGGMSFNAAATPMIDGAISFSGTFISDNIDDLNFATQFNEFSNVVVSTTGGTGSYAPVLSGQAVTFNPFTFSPALSPDPLAPLWTFDFDGVTYSFDATGLASKVTTANTITMQGPGIAHITNFEDTPGNWYFSANRAGGTGSFSASVDVNPVPEPATMLLLGSGLIGLAAIGRKRLKK